jgi:hypothetical protein
MYSWRVVIQPKATDPFVFPSPGKVRVVRYDLISAGFTVLDTDDYYSLLAHHSLRRYMTVFSLRYGEVYDLGIEHLY